MVGILPYANCDGSSATKFRKKQKFGELERAACVAYCCFGPRQIDADLRAHRFHDWTTKEKEEEK